MIGRFGLSRVLVGLLCSGWSRPGRAPSVLVTGVLLFWTGCDLFPGGSWSWLLGFVHRVMVPGRDDYSSG